MRPTYDELIKLNPRLQNKDSKDLYALMDTIEQCGYVWDPHKKIFNNPTINRGIRTEGLDIFTPENFRETHVEIEKNIVQYPESERAKGLWAFWILKLIALIILWGMFSWIIVGWRIWLFGLLGIAITTVAFYYYCSKRWKKTI